MDSIMTVPLLRSTCPGDDVKTIYKESSAHCRVSSQRDDIVQKVNTSLDCLAGLRKGHWGIYHPCSQYSR